MAALYLHQALFANEAPPPTITHRPARGIQGSQLSSFSSVTLHTPSETSHASASLAETYAESAAYQELLARQPLHPSEATGVTELTFEGEPITDPERRRRWQQTVSRRVRRLKWARRLLTVIIGGWAAYNATRYFIAFTVYSSHVRQVTLLALGSVAMLALACTSTSQLLGIFAPRLGWKASSKPTYGRVRTSLDYVSSVLLLGPAIVNLVFVFVWRRSSDASDAIEGRCHWDVDVAWSGRGFQCDSRDAVPWGFWLAGSIVRLVLTAVILTAYHFISLRHSVVRHVSRRGASRTHSHSISYISSVREAFRATSSNRSSQAMVSAGTNPASVPRMSHLPSQATSESDLTRESASCSSSSEHHTLRRSTSHILTEPRIPNEARTKNVRLASSGRLQPSAHSTTSRSEDAVYVSPRSSEESLSSSAEIGHAGYTHYGPPVDRNSGMYTVIPPSLLAYEHLAEPLASAQADYDVHMSVDRFQDLLTEVSRETEEAIQLAQSDRSDLYADEELSYLGRSYEPFPIEEDDGDFVPVVGRMIQRMPTIESLGSREIMSLSSGQRGDRSTTHSLSRPPTRSNTLTMSEAAESRPVSRSNSLTAGVVLSSPLDGQPPVNELGEIVKPHANSGYSSQPASRSTASYYTAVGSTSSADKAVMG